MVAAAATAVAGTTVGCWLRGNGLSQYVEAFEAEGWDDLTVLKASLSGADLEAMGIVKRGQVAKACY
jgi:hypothetical protein